jgi:hypothetical protein
VDTHIKTHGKALNQTIVECEKRQEALAKIQVKIRSELREIEARTANLRSFKLQVIWCTESSHPAIRGGASVEQLQQRRFCGAFSLGCIGMFRSFST